MFLYMEYMNQWDPDMWELLHSNTHPAELYKEMMQI